jgi:hypothetical protein
MVLEDVMNDKQPNISQLAKRWIIFLFDGNLGIMRVLLFPMILAIGRP